MNVMEPSRNLPVFSESLVEIQEGLRTLGKTWAISLGRPSIQRHVLEHWDALLESWKNSSLPIIVRKSGLVRGSTLEHHEGRTVIVADNSPAHWSFSQAYSGQMPTLSDIRKLLEQHQIPFSYARKTAEREKVTHGCTLASADNVNKRGWKLCHMDGIGLATRTALIDVSLDKLLRHFIMLMAPSNHFLVPKHWAGLGEIPEFIDEIQSFEKRMVG
jgi:hypothetical protein